MNNYISLQELNVLKKIVEREELLTQLHKLIKEFRSSDDGSMIPAVKLRRNSTLLEYLDLMRVRNVEVIELVTSWRRSFVQPPPFVYNGVNYLLKVVSDLGIEL